ncbi:hypothetical protein HOLleu_00159 [Holothuria leucospilota]|uniref:Uncharacterized protein n=1 Tax=Holothuria leucospilota TaxID=206669 RepID=A0A9Q1CP00_HOLLE|nr:hypothetical protein HOLleu_00159 [Holothuria leucospilota]
MYVGLFANTAWQLFVCLILAGIGSGAVALPTFIALRDCFQNSFGTVNSASLLVANVSGFVFPLVVEYWKTKYGFRPTLLLTGAMGLHFLITAVCLPPARESTSTSQGNKEPAIHVVKNETCVSKILYTAHPSLFTLCVFLTIALIQLMGFSVYLYPYGLSKGFASELCAVMVALSGTGSLFGRISTICYYRWNLTSNPTVVASPYLILLATQIWSITSTNAVVVIAMAFVSGIVGGQSTAWATSIVKDLSCTNHFNSAATWLSFWGGVGSTFGGLIVGKYLA